MNLSKYALAGILALTVTATGFAGTRQAQPGQAPVKIYITGSTAFRSAATPAIGSILSGSVSIAYDGLTAGVTSENNANAVTWTGGTIGGTAVTIKASWSGSAGGIQTVAGRPNFNVRFLPDGAAGSNNSDPRQTGNPAESSPPDMALSDAYQGATPFNGTFHGVTYANLLDHTVGVVTFVFAASKNFPLGTGSGTSSSYSMTPQLAQALYPVGAIPLSMITGNNTTDRNIGVYATGRDFDSGTRLTAVSEPGVGVSTILQQWKPTVVGSTITALALYPVTTINGVSTGVPGNGGESSGSSLRAYLNNTLTAAAYQTWSNTLTNGYLMTYLGVGDYNNVSANAVKLKYAGFDFSQQAVEEGQYTFWGYEHLDWKSDLGNGTTGGPAVKLTCANNLKTQITNSTSAVLNPNVSLGDMQVQRFSDGGTVTPINF